MAQAQGLSARVAQLLRSDSARGARVDAALAAGLLLSNLALTYCQLSFFPIFSDNADAYFHSLMYLMPFAAAATSMALPAYAACALVLGLALWAHAGMMPLDYYEMVFQNPAAAIAFSVVWSAVLWLFVRGGLRLREARMVGKGSPVRRALPLVAVLGVASVVITFTWSRCFTLFMYGPEVLEYYPLGEYLSSMVGDVSVWGQVLFDWLVWSLLAVGTDIYVARLRAGEVGRSVRAVFQRWLLAVVVAAFLITNTIGYCLETVQAMQSATESLDGQVTYLSDQVSEHVERLSALQDSENTLVLSKARTAAHMVASGESMPPTQAEVEDLRDALGLATLTVCNEDGLVVADSDGKGIGSFNFADSEDTQKYLNLLGSQVDHLIEEPRSSVDEDGVQGDVVSVFAGVSLPDDKGFVQVSIADEDYQRALSAASIDRLLDNYTFGSEGLAFISYQDTVVTSNDPEMVGVPLQDVFTYEPEMRDEVLDELVSGEVVPMQNNENMGILYLEGRELGDYDVFIFQSSDDVFQARTSTILLNAFFYLVLFAGVFVLATLLLDNVVVRGFKRTNGVLARITAGDLDQYINEHETEEFDSLSDGINATVGALKESIAEAEARFDRELATAKAIQESALPRTFPPFPEVEAFDIYASMNAAKEVGGDFYDFFLVDDHTLGFLIADVSGKGIPASLFMMTAKTELENYMSTGMPLAEAVQTANHHLCQGNDAGMFVTVWAATLDYETGELTYVNAGHNFPLLRHGSGGEWEWLKQKCGLFLGTFETAKYRQKTLSLEPGDEIILYTDGVNEAFSAAEEEYGNDRLEAFLAAHNDLHPRSLVEALRADVAAWAKGAEQSDDITMVCLEYGVAPEVSASLTVPAKLDQLDRVMGFIHAELGKRLCPIGAQNKLDIALEEMFVNVCNYAYAGQDGPGSVTVSYVYTPQPASITIQLDDTGIPFDPLQRRDPTMPADIADIPIGGLGIMMTKRSVDDISYVRDGDHNVLAFTKRW